MVSVCMATFNGARYIKEQTDSILAQLGEGDELIVSDDGSTDATLDILRSYDDLRIKIIHHHKQRQKYTFGYTAANFEHALREAAGDYIFLADQDDVWLPGKVKAMKDKLQSCDMVLSDCSYVDASLRVLVRSKFEFEKVKTGALRNLYKCGYLGSSMAFRRELLPFVLPFPKNVPHDLWIGLAGEYVGKFELLKTPTMLYRRHDQNVSQTNNNLLHRQKSDITVRMTSNTNTWKYRLAYRYTVAMAYIRFILVNMNRRTTYKKQR